MRLLSVGVDGRRRFQAEATEAFRFLREDGLGEPELDSREHDLEVYVIRLHEGRVPLLVEEPEDRIYLTDLLAIRAPQVMPVMLERIGNVILAVLVILGLAAEHAEIEANWPGVDFDHPVAVTRPIRYYNELYCEFGGCA